MRKALKIGLVALVALAAGVACSSSSSDAGGGGGAAGSAGSGGAGGSAGDDSGAGGSAGDDSGAGGSAGDDAGAITKDGAAPEAAAGCTAVTIPTGGVWADSVIDQSSEYSSPDWAATQATGAPDCVDSNDELSYSDCAKAWASLDAVDGEWIELGFPAQATNPTTLEIFEPIGQDGIASVDVTYGDASTETLTRTPANEGACPKSSSFSLTQDKQVTSVKITVNQVIVGYWTEIDAVGLR